MGMSGYWTLVLACVIIKSMKKQQQTRSTTNSHPAPLSFQLSEDFKTTEELAHDPRLLLRQLETTGRSLVITDEGKPKGVLMSVDVFEQLIHNLNLGRLLLEAEEDIRKGRTQPLDDWYKEFQRANAIPGRNQRRRQA